MALLEINLRVPVIVYGVQLSDKEDILTNTCKTSGRNDLTLGYIDGLCKYETYIYSKTCLNIGRLQDFCHVHQYAQDHSIYSISFKSKLFFCSLQVSQCCDVKKPVVVCTVCFQLKNGSIVLWFYLNLLDAFLQRRSC